MFFKKQQNEPTAYLYITFYTTDQCMATEYVCKEHQLPGKLVPAPRLLTTGCGLAWRSEPQLQAELERLLTASQIEWEKMTVL